MPGGDGSKAAPQGAKGGDSRLGLQRLDSVTFEGLRRPVVADDLVIPLRQLAPQSNPSRGNRIGIGVHDQQGAVGRVGHHRIGAGAHRALVVQRLRSDITGISRSAELGHLLLQDLERAALRL
ncbi:MAG: hypothetical protein EBV30_01490, partial [Actinobacteria bacterium]|nr:hypothetical protein [Actinomycetota bacterium]